MATKKNSTKSRGEDTKAIRRDALRLFNLLNDESIAEDVRSELWGYTNDVCTDSPLFDPANNKAHFLTTFADGWHRGRGDERRTVREILDRLDKGEPLESITSDFNRRLEEQRERREAEELNRPEPRDWRSDEWRYWKIGQLRRAFESGEAAAKVQAWKEYRALLTGLVADPNFWHVSFAVNLLPGLISARQEIAGFISSSREEKRKPLYFIAEGKRKGRKAAAK
jgi:hypothetical protein